jgi:hypothetical protein
MAPFCVIDLVYFRDNLLEEKLKFRGVAVAQQKGSDKINGNRRIPGSLPSPARTTLKKVWIQARLPNRNLGKFWRVLQWKMLVYVGIWYMLVDTWSILRSFVNFYGFLV